MRSIQSLIKLSPALLVVLLLVGPAPAVAAPCCTITDIDTKKGVVGARETTSGRQFQFRLTNPVLVHRIKVGQGVEADFAAGKVTVTGIDGRYPIIGTVPSATGTKVPPSVAVQGSPQAKNTLPTSDANNVCCTITAVDARNGVASARENATGGIFKFVANDKKTSFQGLKPGQGVYAHFASKQVSLDGRFACCRITESPPASKGPGRGGVDQGSAPSEEFDQGSTSSGGFDQGSTSSGGFDQGSTSSGGFDQGSMPSSGFEQGSTPSEKFGQGSIPASGFDQGSLQQGSSGSAELGAEYKYSPSGGQLQGDRPWYEKNQGPVDSSSGGGQSQGDWSETGTNANSTGAPFPPKK